ncbi:unnamed protein product, partial [Sphacelaria rigidula]
MALGMMQAFYNLSGGYGTKIDVHNVLAMWSSKFCERRCRGFMGQDVITKCMHTQLRSKPTIISGNEVNVGRCARSSALVLRAVSLHQGRCGTLSSRSIPVPYLTFGL